MSKFLSFGLESTAHTFGVGIVDEKCNVLANEKSALITQEGGILPREAADHHLYDAKGVLDRAFDKAGVEWKDVDLISYSMSPGLGPCLRVGLTAAKTLSLMYDKPIIGVNHCLAHIEIGKVKTKAKDPLSVYASGANTQIIAYENGKYRVFGETLDTGIGNLLDTFGRSLGLGFPAGPIIDQMYFEGKELIDLPYSVKGMDLNFSGLLTSAEIKLGKFDKTDLAYSLMHTAFAMLTEVSERALMYTRKKEVLLTGGVACSKALRKMMSEMCEEHNVKFVVPEPGLCADNGAMIAWLGLIQAKYGKELKVEKAVIDQKQRVDQVEIKYI